MSLGNILLVMVILTPVGVLPVWSHARSWGCGNYGIVGIVLLIVIVLLAAGRLPSPPVIGAPHSSERT